jgi:aminoglycoside phosphotransferase (APT) family kinase protein
MAYYDARVHIEGTEAYRVRPIVVTWALEGEADRRQGRDDLAELQVEALRRGVAAPFRQLTAELPEWGMNAQVSPLDAQFPQLVRMSDPLHVSEMLKPAYAASDLASDRSRRDGYAVTSIRYRLGHRHVLRYDPLDSAKGGTVFAKLYTGEEGPHAFDVARQVADWLAEHGEGVRSVRPLGYVAEDGVVLYPRVQGAPLSEHLRRRPSQDVGRFLERAGAALRTLHHLPPAVASHLRPHHFAAVVSKIAHDSDQIRMLLPSVGAPIDAQLKRAQELHKRLPQGAPTFTHGDFKAEHVWVTPDGLTLIDFDSCHFGDPALDVGKFLAELRFWYAIYGHKGVEQAQERFLAGYASGAPAERVVRARVYESVEMLKLAVSRIHRFEGDWASRTKWLIGRAEAVLNGLQPSLGFAVKQSPLPGQRG